MDKQLLRKVQLVQLEIAKEFKRVCNELNLNYFLDSGTLLGAVRHKGFIPWDDDLDVGMIRNEYDAFLRDAPAILSERFFLQSWYSDPQYGLAFAKLRMRKTVYIEEASQSSSAENGFYIDIFPYDVFPTTKKEQSWQGKRYEFFRRAILVKARYEPWIMNSHGLKRSLKKLGYLPIKMYSGFSKREKMILRYETACQRFNGSSTGFLFEQAGASNYGKWVIPEECFKFFTEMPFEGDLFMCPGEYDLYLTSAYGDYMRLPPENKRYNRHKIIQIAFPDE